MFDDDDGFWFKMSTLFFGDDALNTFFTGFGRPMRLTFDPAILKEKAESALVDLVTGGGDTVTEGCVGKCGLVL